MLDVLGQDFVRTARAKGVADRAVVFKHALRNALIPVVAMAGTQFVYLIGGAVIIEEVFALPGMGRLVVNAIYQRDYTMIQGAVLLLTSAAVLVNLAVDLLYHVIDAIYCEGTKGHQTERFPELRRLIERSTGRPPSQPAK